MVDASELLRVASGWARKRKEDALISRAEGLTSGLLLPVCRV